MSASSILDKYKSRIICPRCERYANRDLDYEGSNISSCPACGWRGKTITIGEYVERKLYKS